MFKATISKKADPRDSQAFAKSGSGIVVNRW
jgi:hypothetical protein